MKKYLLLFLIIPVSTIAQIRYEPGYFINNDNSRTECLINNVEWLNNPTEFKYRMNENGDTKVASIDDVNEFGVGALKYVRVKVKMDTSEQSLRDLNKNRYPEWKEKTLFLKVLIDGKAKLYGYRNSTFTRYSRFFYSVDGRPVEQLLFKEFFREGANLGTNTFSGNNPQYKSPSTVYLQTNKTYLQQLKNDVSCGKVDLGRLKNLQYDEKSLTRHFREYNICNGEEATDQPTSSDFHFTVTPGIDFGRLELNDGTSVVRDYPKESGFRLGVMCEIVLPFHRNRWSVMIEPTYQSYTSGQVVEYQSVEALLGLRHSFFIGKQSSLFLNGSVVGDLPMRYEVKWSALTTLYEKNPAICAAGGAGFRWKRLSIEGRYYSWRSTLDGYFKVYGKSSVIFGFRIK